MSKKSSKKSVVKKEDFKYKIEILVNDSVFKFKTNDVFQTLKEFKEGDKFPFPFKTRLIVKYGKSKLSREKIYFSTIDSKRLFENKTSLELLANQITKELE
jgi:hypothetical protein